MLMFSAMMAFTRGFVREMLGIGSWVGSGIVALWAFPVAKPHFRSWIMQPDVADVAALGSSFVVSLLVLSIASGMLGNVVRSSALDGIDRTFGILFGLLRGAVVLAVAYIMAGMVTPPENWPEDVQAARALPIIYQSAVLAVSLLPEEYRPVVHTPPGSHLASAGQLLRLMPQGRALARP